MPDSLAKRNKKQGGKQKTEKWKWKWKKEERRKKEEDWREMTGETKKKNKRTASFCRTAPAVSIYFFAIALSH